MRTSPVPRPRAGPGPAGRRRTDGAGRGRAARLARPDGGRPRPARRAAEGRGPGPAAARLRPIRPPVGSPPVRRLAVLSMHTSPLAQPGTGDGGGMNVYVRELTTALARAGVECDVYTRAWSRACRPR